MNWKRIRFIKTIPIFQTSWIGLLISTYLILGFDWANTQLSLDLTIPFNLWLALLGTILLAFGSSIFTAYCPPIILDFTESEWVYAHKNARQIYKSISMQKLKPIIISTILTLSGGLLLLTLAGTKVLNSIILLF